MTEAPLRLAGLDRALVFGCWLAYVLVGAQTTIATDTARDLIAAWDIVQGVQLPLRGPELYATWTLGPIWYYLLALPLWLTHSAAVAAWMVAILAGLKFPLAYRLGAEWGGLALARLSLLAIALPGWWMFEWLVTSHTNLAAPLLIGYALWLLRWARGGGGVALAVAGLLFSLSVHAHPTSLFWVWLLVPAMWTRRTSRGGFEWQHLLGAALLFLLPFAPMLLDELRTGWPMLDGTRAFVATREGPSLLSRLLPFLVDLVALDRQRMPGQFLTGAASIGIGLITMTAIAWLICALGLLRWPLSSKTLLPAVLAVLAGAMFLLWLRPEVPYWMVYAITPGIAAVLALGWQAALTVVPEARRVLVVNVFSCLVMAAFLGQVAQRWSDASAAWVKVPFRVVGLYADPHKSADTSIPNPAYPVAGMENWVRWLCAQPNQISVHGEGAALLTMAQGSLHVLHCARDRRWEIGGVQGEAVALYPMAALAVLGVDPVQRFGGMGRLTVDAILRPAEARSDELWRAYPPWPLTQTAREEFTLPINTESPRLLAISNLRVVYNGVDTPELLIDGNPIAPVTRSAATWFFRVPVRTLATVRVRSGDPRWIEVLALADRAAR
jgi:hypothetical protein